MSTHTVLLVEDEEELRDMMREALEQNGYQVVAAQDGQEALDQIGHIERLCLVLLDLVMPGMNGWEFFDKMKERPELANIPVVIHSSSPSRAPLGATRVLQKPLKLDRLLMVVQEFCSPDAARTNALGSDSH